MNAFLEEQIAKRTRELEQEKEKSEGLLLNILPAHTAMELKATGKTQARFYEMVTIVFVDFVGFSRIASTLKPQELLDALNTYFSAYDKAVRASGLEKIKTIGDAYLVVAGVPQRRDDHALAASKLALEILKIHHELAQTRQGQPVFQCRIGLHSGPVMAGVAGELKFCYDVWGDTVNLAARMEAAAEAGTINISKATRQALGDCADVRSRGNVQVKNHEDQEMFLLEGLRAEAD